VVLGKRQEELQFGAYFRESAGPGTDCASGSRTGVYAIRTV
jgi:hypothetical protein